ncbi:Uncharacterised protein [Propionibacterium australiense]|uniref:Uncharacterized protein n=1 Tax=Propionibacterium australiense TaxID=119981 RepID=A0A383S2L6_9ACTN|nr:Hypothetical protein PROPAUS_0095 [Propionibacterium australiense]VEH90647.1 Uncharacterised protein [Propionibacterium australiense]
MPTHGCPDPGDAHERELRAAEPRLTTFLMLRVADRRTFSITSKPFRHIIHVDQTLFVLYEQEVGANSTFRQVCAGPPPRAAGIEEDWSPMAQLSPVAAFSSFFGAGLKSTPASRRWAGVIGAGAPVSGS